MGLCIKLNIISNSALVGAYQSITKMHGLSKIKFMHMHDLKGRVIEKRLIIYSISI
jgi:hypothetical protein